MEEMDYTLSQMEDPNFGRNVEKPSIRFEATQNVYDGFSSVINFAQRIGVSEKAVQVLLRQFSAELGLVEIRWMPIREEGFIMRTLALSRQQKKFLLENMYLPEGARSLERVAYDLGMSVSTLRRIVASKPIAIGQACRFISDGKLTAPMLTMRQWRAIERHWRYDEVTGELRWFSIPEILFMREHAQ